MTNTHAHPSTNGTGVRSQPGKSNRSSELDVALPSLDALSEDQLPHDAGDFRLVDRRILEELKQIDDYFGKEKNDVAVEK